MDPSPFSAPHLLGMLTGRQENRHQQLPPPTLLPPHTTSFNPQLAPRSHSQPVPSFHASGNYPILFLLLIGWRRAALCTYSDS